MTEQTVALDSVVDLVVRRQRARAEAALLTEEAKVLDERIKAAWGSATEATIGGEPAGTWQEVTSRKLDQARLKAEYPDVVAACMYTSTVRTFRLTWQPPEQDSTAAPEQESDF